MFHLKLKPSPPVGVGRETPGHAVGLLGDRDHARVIRVERLVELAQKGDGLQVLAAAVLVGDPLPLPPRVVEIEHRGDRVDPQPVDVELLDPVAGVGNQEVAHLVPSEVEDQGSPVRLLAAARIVVLVEGGPVEARQGPVVAREMGGNPVEDDPDAMLVEVVDEAAEVIGVAEPRGRGVVAGDLIPPGAVEGVLAHRQQLDMGETGRDAVGGELLGEVAVAEDVAVQGATPGAQVHLVDGERTVEHRPGRPALQPGLVRPGVPALLDDAGGPGWDLGPARQRIRLVDAAPGGPDDPELVLGPGSDAGDEELPHSTGPERPHRLDPAVPPVGVADQAHPASVRSPHGEGHPGHPLVLDDPGPQPAPELTMLTLADQVQVEVAECRPEAVGVVHLPAAQRTAAPESIAGQLGDREGRLEQAALVYPRHRHHAAVVGDCGLHHIGVVEAHHGRVAGGVGSQDLVGIVVGPGGQPGAGGDERGALGDGHGVPARRKLRGTSTQSGRWPSS